MLSAEFFGGIAVAFIFAFVGFIVGYFLGKDYI